MAAALDRSDPDLTALAAAHGVATRYQGSDGAPVEVGPDTVRAVLAALDVPTGSHAQVRAQLAEAVAAPWRRLVDPSVLVVDGESRVRVTVPAGTAVEAAVTTAQGVVALVLEPEPDPESRTVDGVRRERRTLLLPPALPVGAHRLTVRAGADEQTAHLLVVPPRCPVPTGLRAWGWQVQLYALRSRDSWGIGDLGDLATLVRLGAAQGAGLVLLNPLHAALPVLPQEPSPYYPASRRFTNPLYLRVEHCDGYRGLPPAQRERVDALAATARAASTGDRIDRDAAFRAKTEAFEILAAQPLAPERQAAFHAYRQAEGQGLTDFATACALAERHGRDWRQWPDRVPPNRVPSTASVPWSRVVLHLWLQWQCDEQLAAAAAAAAGMPVGLVTDLAVGVDPAGADAWALQADLAQAVTVGAPPDAFNQRGQDWQLPPLRPDRLPLTGYAPFRDLLRSQLRHAGGLRIDHILGLFRLFWIPDGASPAEGTYVRYPSDALLGVLALEAHAAGALVVGEDLGTVERGARRTLRDRGVLGSRVLWFERAEAGPDGGERPRLRRDEYPELALTSVTTHDLPTAAGFLAGEPARVRAALGQLRVPLEVEQARAAVEREELVALMVADGALDERETGDDDAVARAFHAFVAATPSLLVTAMLGDAVGDLRQPNLPGTTDEYPNWRLPLARPIGAPRGPDALLPPSRPLLLEDVETDPEVARLAGVLRGGRDDAGSASVS